MANSCIKKSMLYFLLFCKLNFNRQKKKGEYDGKRDISGAYHNAD